MNPPRATSDELRDRTSDRIDKSTLRWWDGRFDEVIKGNRGCSPRHDLRYARRLDSIKNLEKLREENEQLRADLEAANAVILEVKARVDRIAEWANNQKGKT